MSKTINLLELFVSIQGEGQRQGKVATFLRFKDCNLKCEWCDTMLRMKTGLESTFAIKDIIDHGFTFSNGNFVITGGEPTLQKYHQSIIDFIDELLKENKRNKRNFTLEFETNGYKIIDLLKKVKETFNSDYEKFNKKIFINFSPKYNILDGENPENQLGEILDNLINVYKIPSQNVIIKLVVSDKDLPHKHDFLVNIITKLIKIYNISKDEIYLMPQGASKEELANVQNIYRFCLQYGLNFSSRLHIMHNMY